MWKWCIGVCMVVAAIAQAQDVTPFSLQRKGLRVGMVGTTFVGADAGGASMQANLSAGGFAVFALRRFAGGELGLQVEVLYTRRTTEQDIQLGGGGYTLRYDLAYVELPLLVRLVTTVGHSVLAPVLGIVPAFRLSGELEQAIPNSVPKPVRASFHSTDLGFVAGIGTGLLSGALHGCSWMSGSSSGHARCSGRNSSHRYGKANHCGSSGFCPSVSMLG